uniref:Secreted protein n=1 Tax=Ixodes ricinus TaxID=34613 RepID=A0A6B0U9W1_IXORI
MSGRPRSSSPLMVARFLARRLALMAAIFSTDMASERDLICSVTTGASFGASRRAENCSLALCIWVSSRRGFLTASVWGSSAVLLTWVGISMGALLSMLAEVAVSPLR